MKNYMTLRKAIRNLPSPNPSLLEEAFWMMRHYPMLHVNSSLEKFIFEGIVEINEYRAEVKISIREVNEEIVCSLDYKLIKIAEGYAVEGDFFEAKTAKKLIKKMENVILDQYLN